MGGFSFFGSEIGFGSATGILPKAKYRSRWFGGSKALTGARSEKALQEKHVVRDPVPGAKPEEMKSEPLVQF